MSSERLARHLADWLGAWPPARAVHVVGSPLRNEPGWDGRIYPLAGVGDGTSAVISVPPEAAGADVGPEDLDRLPALLGWPGAKLGRGVFRWCERPPPLPDAGQWVPSSDPRLPGWLRPFPGDVLVAWGDDGAWLAGVGRKPMPGGGQELAVVTDPAAQGKGLARRLVAQAARRALDEGGIATYLHHPANHASAHVAEASGFPDRGWSVYGLPTAS